MSEPANKVEEIVPLNLAAIMAWCDKYRPDLKPVIWAERNKDYFIAMMAIGFEAGRHFQKDRPDFPMEASNLYLNQAVPVVDGKEVKPDGDPKDKSLLAKAGDVVECGKQV